MPLRHFADREQPRRFGAAGWTVAAIAIGIVVLFAGSRASWITYALVLLFSGWKLLGWKKLLAVFAAGAYQLVKSRDVLLATSEDAAALAVCTIASGVVGCGWP